MQYKKEDLCEFADLAQTLVKLKDEEEVRAIIDAIPPLAAEVKPFIEGLNEFVTAQDIAAVKQIMAAGFTAEQAITLRTARKFNPVMETLGAVARKIKE